jgi:UDP-glucose 4-epimerase
MKVLVIGGGGFLGSYVADELTLRDHKVKIFDKKKSKWIQKKQQMILGNIQNLKTLEKAIKNSDIVYNFAAIADIGEAMKNPIQTV